MSVSTIYFLLGWLVGSFFGVGAVLTFARGIFAKPATAPAA